MHRRSGAKDNIDQLATADTLKVPCYLAEEASTGRTTSEGPPQTMPKNPNVVAFLVSQSYAGCRPTYWDVNIQGVMDHHANSAKPKAVFTAWVRAATIALTIF
jgi:hypothetical protein